MLTKGNFILLEKSEFKNWLDNKKVTRKITTLQVHHTYLPNYSTRKDQDPFKCLEGMRISHLKQGWAATGQHISIFENGQLGISIDRDLNDTPAGIKGQNTGGVTIEIIGNFNLGGDTMTAIQKETVIHLYACLANKFKIPIDTDHIVYHCWFTSAGIRLQDFSPNKSSKTCPGTAFFGGNTISMANKYFLPAIKAEFLKLIKPVIVQPTIPVPSEVIPITPTQPVTPTPTQVKDDDQVDKVKIIFTKDNSVVEGFMKDNTNYVSVAALKELGLIKATWDNNTKKLYIS